MSRGQRQERQAQLESAAFFLLTLPQWPSAPGAVFRLSFNMFRESAMDFSRLFRSGAREPLNPQGFKNSYGSTQSR